jgi:hypothetical protein
MTTAYVYKWTNINTGKWYIGSRTAKNCHPDDGYICSSRKLKPIILESKDEWQREILCIGNPVDMLELEGKYLSVLDAKHDTMSYNMHNGDGKFTTAGKEAWNKGIKRPTGKPAWNSGVKCPQISAGCMGRTPHNKGKAMSEALKQNLSEKMTGRPSPKKGKPGTLQTAEANAKRSESLKGRESPNKGRTHVATEERKAKIKAALLAYHAKKKGT